VVLDMAAALELAVVQVVVRAVELVVEADLGVAAVPVEAWAVGMALVVASVVGQEQVGVWAVELVVEEDLVAAAVRVEVWEVGMALAVASVVGREQVVELAAE
jgi:hypothetical protein